MTASIREAGIFKYCKYVLRVIPIKIVKASKMNFEKLAMSHFLEINTFNCRLFNSHPARFFHFYGPRSKAVSLIIQKPIKATSNMCVGHNSCKCTKRKGHFVPQRFFLRTLN